MATPVDPLRRTLDTHRVDPSAASDKPYLESMLRRLGYSDAEIAAYMSGSKPMPAGVAKPSLIPEDNTERHIELEYTGPGLRQFNLVIGVDESEMPALAAGMEAGTEVFEGGPSMEEVDRLVAEGKLEDFDDWGEDGPKEDAVGSMSEVAEEDGGAPKLEAMEEEPDLTTPAGEGAPAAEGEASAEGTTLDLNLPTPSGPPTLPEKPGEAPEDFQVGENLVEFQETPVNEAVTEVVPEDASTEELRAQGWEVAPDLNEEAPATAAADSTEDAGTWETVEAAPDAPFTYNDWALYSRDELRGDQAQRIYFFSKGAPEGAEPAGVPDGYEVAENPDTGRPFLRRVDEMAPADAEPVDIDTAHPSAEPGAAPRKRVRIQRVRAASKEDALRKMQADGRNVIASMPIDIERRLGE